MKSASLLVSAIAVLLINCGNGIQTSSTTPLSYVGVDALIPLAVTGVSPDDGSTGISISTTITVTFNKNIDPLSINDSTFLVNGAAMGGYFSFGTNSVTFRPDVPLINLAAYTVTLTDGVTDSNGKTLASPFLWSFTTVDYDQVAAPSFSPIGGHYTTPQSVTLHTDTAGATIRYTTDGSDPVFFGTDTPNDTVISVPDTMLVRAYAYLAPLYDSAEASAQYVLAPTIGYVNPNSGPDTDSFYRISITGTNFKNSPSAPVVTLFDGSTTITAASVNYINSTAIDAYFDLTGYAAGNWSVTVTNSDTGSATLAGGFRIYTQTIGLISRWEFNGNTVDSGPGGNGGSINGAGISYSVDRLTPANPTGAIQNANATSYVQANTGGFPTGSANRTIMGWIYINAHHAANEYLFGYGDAAAFNAYMLLVEQFTKTLIFSEGSEYVIGTTYLQASRWYHVAVTNNGNTITLYVDGFKDGEGTFATLATTTAGNDMYFFKHPLSVTYFEGVLDDVRVYGRELSQAEIQSIIAENGFLNSPQNVYATKGVDPFYIDVTWDPVTNATGYDVLRSATLTGAYTAVNAVTITGTGYRDSSVTTDTIYYYKVVAKNGPITSPLSKANIGYAGATNVLTDNFETGAYSTDWTSVTGAGTTTYAVVNGSGYGGTWGLSVTEPTCPSGCGFGNQVIMTKNFATAASYVSVSLRFYRQIASGGEVRVYINNTNPSDDTGWIRFFNQTQPGGSWLLRYLIYFGEPGTINSVTIVYTDMNITSSPLLVDDIVIYYK
ncbi:MAG: Ig-like domain-containing protein [Spirochaetes bacterium]|nr:Ig-like domain-containing protein [Spirochaetota bacterium]